MPRFEFRKALESPETEIETLLPATTETTTEEEVKPKVTLIRNMLGTYWNTTTGMWHIVTAKFDPATGTLGEYKDTPENSDWGVLRERVDILMTGPLNMYEKENP